MPRWTAEQKIAIEDRGGALLIEEKDCTGEKLYQAVRGLLDDGAGRDRMRQAQLSLAAPTAAEDIYQVLMELMGKEH